MTPMSEPTPEQLSELEVDSGMSGEAVEQAECLWAQLPTGRPWTSLGTYEKALVCHQFARLRALERPSDEAVERVARAISVPEHHTTWDLLTPVQKDLYYMQARAAIAAMQEQSK